jgi:hypothetical protein
VANINDLPTGSVSISGTPTQGQTLAAGNSLADADGLGTISYQWLADDSDISGTTSSTLTLTQAHVGKAISVKASYTDVLGTAEGKTSTATALVANVNDAPTVANLITDQNATEGVAFTFTVPSNTFADVDSGDTLSYTATLADGATLPSWLQFNANTRTFSGTPGIEDPAELNLKVTASDVAGASVTSAFKVTVARTTINSSDITIISGASLVSTNPTTVSFNGTNGVAVIDNADLTAAFNADRWTIRFQVFPTLSPSSPREQAFFRGFGFSSGINASDTDSGILFFYVTPGQLYQEAMPSLIQNQWNSVIFSRKETALSVEVNGVTRISATDVDFSLWDTTQGLLEIGGMVGNNRYAFGGSIRSISFSADAV